MMKNLLKNIKKAGVAGLLILFVLQNAFGQKTEKEQMGESDPEAEKILKEVSDKYRSYETVRAVFILKIESPEEDLNEEQTGTLYLKDDKYKLEMSSQEIITDNETIWTYLKDANEVQVNKYEVDENTITPSQIFVIYEDNFLYGLIGEGKENGRTVQTIDLTPYDKSKPFFKIRLTIDKEKKQIIRSKIFDKNGNRYIYEIKKLTPNLELDGSFFRFNPDKYPDIEVIDLR